MNVTIKVLGRAAVDQPFAELSTVTATLGAGPLAITPTIPLGAAGQDTMVRVMPDATVSVAIGPWLDPATRPAPNPIMDGQGQTIGSVPAPTPSIRGRYVAYGGAARDIPLHAGESLLVGLPGVPLVAA